MDEPDLGLLLHALRQQVTQVRRHVEAVNEVIRLARQRIARTHTLLDESLRRVKE